MKISQEDINKEVWKACDTFRGSIDPSVYKDYVLTMLFVKYLSDVHDDKYETYLNKATRQRQGRVMPPLKTYVRISAHMLIKPGENLHTPPGQKKNLSFYSIACHS
jgi:type I restriction enzyme M protein